jgi:hypothetical protein
VRACVARVCACVCVCARVRACVPPLCPFTGLQRGKSEPDTRGYDPQTGVSNLHFDRVQKLDYIHKSHDRHTCSRWFICKCIQICAPQRTRFGREMPFNGHKSEMLCKQFWLEVDRKTNVVHLLMHTYARLLSNSTCAHAHKHTHAQTFTHKHTHTHTHAHTHPYSPMMVGSSSEWRLLAGMMARPRATCVCMCVCVCMCMRVCMCMCACVCPFALPFYFTDNGHFLKSNYEHRRKPIERRW